MKAKVIIVSLFVGAATAVAYVVSRKRNMRNRIRTPASAGAFFVRGNL